MGVASHLSGHVVVARHLSGHVAVARHLSGHVGVARHLLGQTLKASLRLSHAYGQQMWTETGHLIVPALSRRELVGEIEPLGVNYIYIRSLTFTFACDLPKLSFARLVSQLVEAQSSPC